MLLGVRWLLCRLVQILGGYSVSSERPNQVQLGVVEHETKELGHETKEPGYVPGLRY